MALSKAEKQRRYRERKKAERVTSVTESNGHALPSHAELVALVRAMEARIRVLEDRPVGRAVEAPGFGPGQVGSTPTPAIVDLRDRIRAVEQRTPERQIRYQDEKAQHAAVQRFIGPYDDFEPA